MRRKRERVTETFGAWEQLVAGREATIIERGDMVYTPEQPASDIVLLSAGQVGLQLLGPEDRSLTLREINPGQLFGHVALVNDDRYDTWAEALTPARMYKLSRADVVQQIDKDPELALQLLDDLGQHRFAISRRLEEVGFKSVPARLASVLLDMAEQEAGQNSARVPRRSHRQLAEMVNAYRETVTKIINQFRAARVLEIDRSTITLINRPLLEELAQGW